MAWATLLLTARVALEALLGGVSSADAVWDTWAAQMLEGPVFTPDLGGGKRVGSG